MKSILESIQHLNGLLDDSLIKGRNDKDRENNYLANIKKNNNEFDLRSSACEFDKSMMAAIDERMAVIKNGLIKR